MKRQMKKLISMILAMAMVVTSINFTPKNVSAENDGSGWTTISNMSYQSSNTPMTLNYKVAKGAESSAIEAYGHHYLHVYPEGLTGADNAKIYLNEGQTTTGETVFPGMKDHDNTRYNIGLGLTDVNLKANTYYSLRFVYGTHDVVYYFYTGNKEDIKEETTTETTTTEPEPSITLQALTKAYVYNYSEVDGGYKVSFTDPNAVTVEDGATYTYTLTINGQTIENIASSGSSVDLSSLNLTEGTEYTVTMNAVYKKGDTIVTSPASSETTFTYRGKTTAYDNGIPQIFINSSRDTKTKDINLYTDTTKTKVNASLMIKGADGSTTEVSNSGTVNVRGNSTSLADKKAYNLKFDSSINPFGMGTAKKWSLLANIFDKTMIRNYMGLNFQRYLESTQTPFENNVSKAFTSNCKNVDLYVDGKYLGTYLLTESVEVGADRVNIDTSYYDKTTDDVKADSTPTTVTINGTEYKLYDALLELANDSRLDTDAYYFKTSVLGQQFGLNDPVCSTDIAGNKLNPSLTGNSADAVKPQFVNDIKSS